MSVGLIALLDDVAAIAKAAAASVDDVVAHAAKAGAKSAGLVIDDAAVTPRYVVGLSPARELPIVAKIAKGSMRNKLLFLLPIALVLSAFAPWVITPILMLGGAYLCYEGAEKVYEALFPHAAHEHEAKAKVADAAALEDQTVTGAIRTDFILSAEIMAIALASIDSPSLWTKAGVLAVVAIAITVLVYGAVALIVKADDVGVTLAANRSESAMAQIGRGFGRGLVKGMPYFLKLLTVVGTAAMVWVGGGIVLHGLEEFGVAGPAHVVHDLAHGIGAASPVLPGAVEWLIGAAGAGIAGLAIGAAIIPLVGKVIAPAARALKGRSVGAS